MKTNPLIASMLLLLLTLTACQTTPTPPPGNEINALLLHPDWQVVATQHPAFVAFVVREFYRMDYEQACTKARLMNTLKEKRTIKAIPKAPPAPAP